MADNDIEIKVVVDSQGAITVLDKLGNEIRKVETATESGSRGFGVLERSVITLNQALELGKNAFGVLQGATKTALDAISRGSAVGDLEEAFGRLTQKAGAVSETFLNELNRATAQTISNFDLMKKSNELLNAGLKPDAILTLSKAARVFAEQDGSNMKDTIDALSQSLLRGDDRFLKTKGIIIDNQKAFADYARALGTTADKLNEVGRAEAIRQAGLKALASVAAQAANIQEDAGDKIEQINKVVADSFDDIKKQIAGNDGVLKFLGDFANGLKIVIPEAVRIATGALNNLTQVLSGTSDSFNLGLKVIKNWATNFISTGGVLRSFDAAVATTYKEIEKQTAAVDKTTQSFDDWLETVPYVNTEVYKVSETVKNDAVSAFTKLEEQSEETKKAMEELRIQLESLNRDFLEFGSQEISGSLLDQLFGEDPKKEIDDFGKSINDAIANVIQGLSQAISSGGFDRGFAGNIGGIFGSLLGKSSDAKDFVSSLFGDSELIAPGLQLVGSLLGESLGKGVFSGVARIFGAGRDEQTEARKAADKYFADIFDANRLSIVVDGELRRIKDLVFGNDTEIFEDGSFDDLFHSLPDAARGAFAGVGIAFEELIGGLEEQGGQLAAVLANNVGGSLNNLQLLIQQTGKSVEDLEGAIIKSFENGTISVLEAQSALLGIQQATQVGIPDGIGLTVEALENMFAAGSKGGIAVLDALQDIGHEAKELGIKDFPALQAQLAASGKFSADQISKVFQALEAHGIESVEALTAATKEELIATLAQLQAEGVLVEAAESALDLLETLDRIPSSKDIELNVRINASQQDRAGLNYLASGQAGGSGPGVPLGG